MSGAGSQPAGSSPAGIGTPGTIGAQNNTLFPDPVTNVGLTGRYIHPITKDYTFAADGRTQGYTTARQLVVLALRTVRGSSAISTLGESFTDTAEKGPNYQRQVATQVAQALAQLTRAKLVQLVSVVVQQPPSNPDGVFAQVIWRDLTAPIPTGTGAGGTITTELRNSF